MDSGKVREQNGVERSALELVKKTVLNFLGRGGIEQDRLFFAVLLRPYLPFGRLFWAFISRKTRYWTDGSRRGVSRVMEVGLWKEK